MIRKGIILLTLCLLSTLIMAEVPIETPTNIIKDAEYKIIKILKDKDLSEKKKIIAVKELANEFFDFEEMSRRTLSIYWKKRTEKEKKEFTELFKELLVKNYFRIVKSYTDEEIYYISEKIKGEYAVVKTMIKTHKGTEIPIEYRMIKKCVKWKVYDIVIEGVSLIKNYRTQFKKIIRSSSYEGLIAKIKDKIYQEEK